MCLILSQVLTLQLTSVHPAKSCFTKLYWKACTFCELNLESVDALFFKQTWQYLLQFQLQVCSVYLCNCTARLVNSFHVNIQEEENGCVGNHSSSGTAPLRDPEDQTPRSVSGPHWGGIVHTFLFVYLFPTFYFMQHSFSQNVQTAVLTDDVDFLFHRWKTCALQWPVQLWTPWLSYTYTCRKPWTQRQKEPAEPCYWNWHKLLMPLFISRPIWL